VLVRHGRSRGLDGDAVAAAVGLPLAGVLPYEEALPLAAERGDPPARSRRSRGARVCERLLEELRPVGTSS
jgi:hypothetical protein